MGLGLAESLEFSGGPDGTRTGARSNHIELYQTKQRKQRPIGELIGNACLYFEGIIPQIIPDKPLYMPRSPTVKMLEILKGTN